MFFRRLVSVRISTSVFYSQFRGLTKMTGNLISSYSQTADTR